MDRCLLLRIHQAKTYKPKQLGLHQDPPDGVQSHQNASLEAPPPLKSTWNPRLSPPNLERAYSFPISLANANLTNSTNSLPVPHEP